MAKKITTKINVLKRGYHRMTLDFGNTYSDGGFHKGIDLTGNPDVDGGYDYAVAIADGTVIGSKNDFAGTTRNTGTAGMGNYVIIEHEDGFRTRYMHMTKGSVKVRTGQKIKAGDIIGYIGNTGNSSGRHLHFDLSKEGRISGGVYISSQNRTYLDPKPYLSGAKTIRANDESYKTGKYVIVRNVNVRKGPGTNYDRVYYSQFTANAKSQVKKIDKSCPDHFPAGVKVSISKVKNNTWGLCPSGWISLKYCERV